MHIIEWDNLPTYSEVELVLPEVIDTLKKFAKESVTQAWKEMPEHAVVSMDGSWDHRRNGKTFILDFICEQLLNPLNAIIQLTTMKIFIP